MRPSVIRWSSFTEKIQFPSLSDVRYSSFAFSDGGGYLKTVPFDSSYLIHLTYLSSASRRPLLRPLLNCHFLTVSVNAPAMSNASMVKKEMTTEKMPMSVMSCRVSGVEYPPPHQPSPALRHPSTSSGQGSGDGSASATPPQGGSDWTIKRFRA